jgi:chromosome segregation ATPase
MRVQVKRVKGECRDLRAHCDEVEKKMTDAHNQKKMIELQMQHAQQQHTQSMQQMMGQLQAAREGEAAQAQIVDRLRAELEKLRNQKNVVQENKEDEALRRQRDDLERRLAHSQAAANRAKELEIELKKLRIYVRDIESKHKRTEVQLKEEQAATGMARTQLRVAEDRVAQLEQERSAMEERIADLKKQNSGQVREIEVIKTKLVKEESEKVQLVLKLGKLKGQIGNLEVQAKNAKGEAEAARRDLMSLQQKYDDLMRKHKSQEGKIEDYEEELARLRREMEALQKEVDRLRAEVEALKAQLAKRDEEDGGKVPQHELDKLEAQLKRALKDLESAIADKSSLAEQLKAAQQELAELRKQLQTKNDEVAKLEKEKKEIKDKAKAQQKLHAKALETAMQSLVRLCVVAPTVNVHLGEQTLGCKAPLPQKTIRNLVEHQILPNFTSIFLQAEEGAGPGGATLDTWLEGLLAEMQSSIERHLKHVFQNEDKQ